MSGREREGVLTASRVKTWRRKAQEGIGSKRRLNTVAATADSHTERKP
jgi:transposase-like protein